MGGRRSTNSTTMPGKKRHIRYIPEEYRSSFGDKDALGSVAAEAKEPFLGPLPLRVATTKALSAAALKGSINTEASTMPEQYPKSFQPLIEDAEAEEAQQAPADYTFAPLPPELVERPKE
jgi:hypothetical protein